MWMTNADGIAAKFVKENLTFTGEESPMNNLLLTLLGAVAEFERAMIHERQREGIALGKGQRRLRRTQAATDAATSG